MNIKYKNTAIQAYTAEVAQVPSMQV